MNNDYHGELYILPRSWETVHQPLLSGDALTHTYSAVPIEPEEPPMEQQLKTFQFYTSGDTPTEAFALALKKASTFRTVHIVFAIIYVANAIAILVFGLHHNLITFTTTPYFKYYPHLNVGVPCLEANSYIHVTWVFFVALFVAAVGYTWFAINTHNQIKTWHEDRTMDTALPNLRTPILCLTRMIIMTAYYALVTQQSGATDIYVQALAGLLTGAATEAFWWSHQDSREIGPKNMLFVALFGASGWAIIITISIQTLQKFTTHSNSLSAGVVGLAFCAWAATIIVRSVETSKAKRSTSVPLTYFYIQDAITLITIIPITWMIGYQLAYDLPRILAAFCFLIP